MIIDQNVSPKAVKAAWQRVESFLMSGGRGFKEYLQLYLNYRYGKPQQYVEMTGQTSVNVNVIRVRELVDEESD
jgi:hypothetical protein